MDTKTGCNVIERDSIDLDLLLEKVYRQGGYDFRDYKRGTVTRRLERRLHATGSETYSEYMRFLDAHSEEYQRLADDLTIKVSGFFRNRYAFQQVAELVLPGLLVAKEKRGEQSLRFWSAACARGEEPYSMAILLAELLGERRHDLDISIYATDISNWALGEAQTGVYSAKDLESLPYHIWQGYFTKCGQKYSLRDDIRQMVTFSCFDLTSAALPSFSGLDCIFCCNVLIYLQRQLQGRVLDMLYGSLDAPGYLVLGEVETPPGHFEQKLECLDSKARIYRKLIN